MTDAYHRGTLRPAQVGAFAYFVPSASEDNCAIICIDLVLPMGWVDSPKYFCAFSETLTDVATALVHTLLPVPAYGAISEIPETGPGPTHTIHSLTHINCYMDGVITAVQRGPDRKREFFDGTVRALKWPFPSLPGKTKDSVSVNKLMAGEGDWTCKKEVLGWRIDTEAGTVDFPERKHLVLLQLLAIPTTQCQMGRKELELMVGKLCSVHLAETGAVAHLYHIHSDLTQRGKDRAWIFEEFHQEISNWSALVAQTVARPTHLAEIVCK